MSLKELINALRKNQFELRCEKVMKTFQKHNHKKYHNEVNSDYDSFIFLEKNYFSKFIDIVSGKSPSIETKNLANYDIEYDKQINLHSLKFFITKLMENDGAKFSRNLQNPKFVNTLSFSLFPAISTYFHLNFLPDEENRASSLGYDLHDFNQIFFWLSNKIKENPQNKTDYQNAFDVLMRPMFCSPLFIDFCIKFFQPIFSNLQDQEIIKKENKSFSIPNFLAFQFNAQFKHFAHLMPAYIVLNLRLSDDPIRTLANSFFKIALNSVETSQYYGLFHFSKPPSNNILLTLQKYFTNNQDSENQVLNSFIEHSFSIGEKIQKQMSTAIEKEKREEFNILTCSCPENKVLKEVSNGCFEYVEDPEARIQLALNMKYYYFENDVFLKQNRKMFRRVLLSENDIELLNYIYSNDFQEFTLQKSQNKYKWINFGFSARGNESEEEEENEEDDLIMMTMANSQSSLVPNIRHLLQNSDPIPEFNTIPEDMTVESFFDDYLVNKGPLGTLSKRKYYKKVIFEICRFQKKRLIKNILDSLKKTTLNQTNEIENLTIATKVQTKIETIMLLIKRINHNINIIKYLVSSNNLTDIQARFNQEYINNPQILYDEFMENLEKYKCNIISKKPQIILMKMIDRIEKNNIQFFGKKISSTIVYQPIFLDFLSKNPFIQSIDNNVSNILRSSFYKIIDIYLNNKLPTNDQSRSKTMKNQFLIYKIQNIRRCRNEIILKCKEAFTELSIFRKVELFFNVMSDVVLWVTEDAPIYVGDIGSDELPVLITSVLFLTNPLYVASNIFLLQKLFYSLNHSCFEGHIVDMVAYSSYALIDLKDAIESDKNLIEKYQGPLKDITKFNDDIKENALQLENAL